MRDLYVFKDEYKIKFIKAVRNSCMTLKSETPISGIVKVQFLDYPGIHSVDQYKIRKINNKEFLSIKNKK